MTTIRSALSTVARRCAITRVVRPSISRSSACCTARSLCASSAEVASSSSSTGASLKQRAGDGDALLLAAGQARSAFAELFVVAGGQDGQEVVRLGGAGRRFDVGVAGFEPAVTDVIARPAGEDGRDR